MRDLRELLKRTWKSNKGVVYYSPAKGECAGL